MLKSAKFKFSQKMEDYLEAIFALSKDWGNARTCEIANTFKVSPSSVVEIIGKITLMVVNSNVSSIVKNC